VSVIHKCNPIRNLSLFFRQIDHCLIPETVHPNKVITQIFLCILQAMDTRENILQAFTAIKGNRLRAILTILIIAFGIMSIVGVLTAIDGIKASMENSFTTLGSNTFRIQNYESQIRFGGGRGKNEYMPPIDYQEAEAFKNAFSGIAPVSLSVSGTMTGKGKYKNLTTNNNLNVRGSDEYFTTVEKYKIAEGRSISVVDIALQRKVAVVGNEIKVKLFPGTTPLGKSILIDNKKYTIIGLFESRGSSFGMGGDKVVLIPVSTLLTAYPSQGERSFTLNVFVDNPQLMEQYIDEAIGMFRIIRKLKPKKENDFGIAKSDTFVNSLLESLVTLRVAAIGIAMITLFGASIGLMNIMLVSVTERTREIGIRKALGATKSNILFQFLTEAIVICQLGGLLGILLGIGIGNFIGIFLSAPFQIPWNWVILGLVICFTVGLISGIYPARKASSLDPIDSLRHE